MSANENVALEALKLVISQLQTAFGDKPAVPVVVAAMTSALSNGCRDLDEVQRNVPMLAMMSPVKKILIQTWMDLIHASGEAPPIVSGPSGAVYLHEVVPVDIFELTMSATGKSPGIQQWMYTPLENPMDWDRISTKVSPFANALTRAAMPRTRPKIAKSHPDLAAELDEDRVFAVVRDILVIAMTYERMRRLQEVFMETWGGDSGLKGSRI